jgi:elongation of very long chain fatty acids protein 4
MLVGSIMFRTRSSPALDLYPVKFVYILSKIMTSAYMTIEALMLMYRHGYSFWAPCVGCYKENPSVLNLLWLFYISKVMDFCDTFFFVIGKKWKRLNFLHIYHHTATFLIIWFNFCVRHDCDILNVVFLNALSHNVVFLYAFVSMHTKVPETGISLPIWWKPVVNKMFEVELVIFFTRHCFLIFSEYRATRLRVFVANVLYVLSLLVLEPKYLY